MANSQGFWSYVHADDQAEGERISRLARDVANQFQMLAGETISLFLDKDSIKWGENWRDLRFVDVASEKYRRGVARLATRLVEANRHAEEVDIATITPQILETPDGTLDDSPGILDRLARAEETLPQWTETLETIGRDI